MYCPRSERRPAQRGVALVIALLVFALCAVLMVSVQREFGLFYQRSGNRLLAEQGWVYLRGAEELAAMALRLDQQLDEQRGQPRDDLTEVWAQPAAPYALDEGGWMMGSLSDLQGRFNLNLLGAQRSESAEAADRLTPAQLFFVRLLLALELPGFDEYDALIVTDSIGDWIDADAEPRLRGAEDDWYAVREPPYRAANQPLHSVSELRAVANVTPELYAALAPLVTVWPQTGAALNIHTLSLPLLRAINLDGTREPLSQVEAERLLEQRAAMGWESPAALLAEPAFGGGQIAEVATLLGDSSAWFLLEARVEIADREMRLYSVLQREGGAVSARVRAAGSL